MPKLEKKIINSLREAGFSPYQVKVYEAVTRIPYGRTRSYKWVAKMIGNPRSSRAVGNALNKNPYPVTIPCHRVIASDGSIGGFARGLYAKMRLLKREGVDIIDLKRVAGA